MLILCVFITFIVMTNMAASEDIPSFKLNNGRNMPAIALGTYLGFDEHGMVKSKDKQLRDAVMKAIDLGYRHFDSAPIYLSEDEVGEAIKMKIESGEVTRDDIFVTTKLWNTRHKKEDVKKALEESLRNFGLEYVDLFLIHWPLSLNDNYTFSNVDYMETWRGMEEVHQLGMAKAIGVSNFNEVQLRRLLRESTIKPAVLQIEVHLSLTQKDLISFAHENGMVVMGYSPFGSLVNRHGLVLPGPKLDDPALTQIAQKHNKTTAQVVLRWLVEKNVVPVPKSVNPKRQAENMDIFDFKLYDDDKTRIDGFNSDTRFTLPSFWQEHPHYPFEKIKEPIADPFKQH